MGQLVEVVVRDPDARQRLAVDVRRERARGAGRRCRDDVDAGRDVAEHEVRAGTRDDLLVLDAPLPLQLHVVDVGVALRRVAQRLAGVHRLAVLRAERAEVGLGRLHGVGGRDRPVRRGVRRRGRARRAACGSSSRSRRTRPRRSGRRARARCGRSGSRPASTGWPRRSTSCSRRRRRPGSGCRARCTARRTLPTTCSNANSGVCTPTITSPAS